MKRNASAKIIKIDRRNYSCLRCAVYSFQATGVSNNNDAYFPKYRRDEIYIVDIL